MKESKPNGVLNCADIFLSLLETNIANMLLFLLPVESISFITDLSNVSVPVNLPLPCSWREKWPSVELRSRIGAFRVLQEGDVDAFRQSEALPLTWEISFLCLLLSLDI